MTPAQKYRPQLRVISPEIAREEKYSQLTNPIHIKNEERIFRSIEDSLAPVNGAWIRISEATFAAARRRRDLIEANLSPLERKLREKGLTQSAKPMRRTREPLEVEQLVSADDRRDGKGGNVV